MYKLKQVNIKNLSFTNQAVQPHMMAQGQLTPQSLVRSGRISNSSKILWMSSLPASMKKIRSKMKALEWTQHFPHYNSMVAMETSGCIWPNFELIQALIHVLITCKYEKNPIKNSGENVMTSFSPLWGFFQTLKGS